MAKSNLDLQIELMAHRIILRAIVLNIAKGDSTFPHRVKTDIDHVLGRRFSEGAPVSENTVKLRQALMTVIDDVALEDEAAATKESVAENERFRPSNFLERLFGLSS